MTLNCKGILLDLHVPKVMGILNITPDSFYDGGRYRNEKAILAHRVTQDNADAWSAEMMQRFI